MKQHFGAAHFKAGHFRAGHLRGPAAVVGAPPAGTGAGGSGRRRVKAPPRLRPRRILSAPKTPAASRAEVSVLARGTVAAPRASSPRNEDAYALHLMGLL